MIYLFVYFAIAVIALLFGSLLARLVGKRKPQLYYNLALLAVISYLLLAMLMAGVDGTFFGSASLNSFSELFMFAFTVAMLLVNLLAYDAGSYPDFAILGNFALMGMYLIAVANSMVTILIGLELMTLPTVFIILFDRRRTEAAAKLFVMSAVSTAFFAFGLALMLSGGGVALSVYPKAEIMLFAAAIFVAAIGFESSIFPFNLWVPDVYEGASTHATAMLGGVNKKAGFAALMQILILVFISYHSLFLLVALLSILTMFFGNIVALAQRNVKRMMAYSSISQAGYILIGIAAATQYGTSASIFQIFAHMFAFIGIMAVVMLMEAKNRVEINDFIGLGSENPIAAFSLSIFLLSLLGMPFTMGFVGKFMLFSSAVYAKLWWLALLGIINTAISLYYYSRLIIAVYTGKAGTRRIRIGLPVAVVIIICLAVVLGLGIYPQPLVSLAQNAAAYLFR
ncbi:MAG: NADH-quinone oxidoreductase subunit N [Candidatus Micrarchaeia archaeon]